MEFAVEQQAGVDRILTREAADFVSMLHRELNPRREELLARRVFDRLTASDELADFLTIPAYEELLKVEQGGKP
jgi:malate synthase